MSVAFLEPLVLWREPVAASIRRLLARGGLAVLWIALGGIPGVFVGLVPWTWLRVIMWIFAVVAILHFALAIANLIKNRRVLLRVMGTGSIEWPTSIQERWFRRPLDWVEGPVVTVAPELGQITGSRAEPRVTLVGGTRTIRRLPLHGVEPEDFVAHVNAVGAQRGLRFEVAVIEDEPDAPSSDSDS